MKKIIQNSNLINWFLGFHYLTSNYLNGIKYHGLKLFILLLQSSSSEVFWIIIQGSLLVIFLSFPGEVKIRFFIIIKRKYLCQSSWWNWEVHSLQRGWIKSGLLGRTLHAYNSTQTVLEIFSKSGSSFLIQSLINEQNVDRICLYF